MATLRPPSTSPSPSPTPAGGIPSNSSNGGVNARTPNARASMGPTNNRIASISGANLNTLSPASPRPGGYGVGNRPTSEVLASAGMGGMFQTPESEAIDQWFENLQNYELILEDMAKASMDANFKDELSAIEQWFRVLSEAERTAALYSLLQHSTQVQIRFFITVLQQMARSDPMTALLSPGMGGSMQQQMEAKLNQMGLKSPGVNSPAARSYAPTQRQSLIIENQSSNFLSPDSALIPPGPSIGSEAAATLAHQRARLKASNAAHRISAPGTLTAAALEAVGRNAWHANLGQVDEGSATPEDGRGSPVAQMSGLGSARPKSTDFAGLMRNMRTGEDSLSASNSTSTINNNKDSTNSVLDMLSPMVGGNWASQVNTPLNPMFANNTSTPAVDRDGAGQTLDAVTSRIANWNISNSSGGKVVLDDAKKFRRTSKSGASGGTGAGDMYDDNGNYISPNGQPGLGAPRSRNVSTSGNSSGPGGGNQWNTRSPSVFSNSSSRFADDSGLGGSGLASPIPGLGMPNFGMGGMNGMNGMDMNMLMNQMNAAGMAGMAGMGGMGMGINPNLQAQLLAAQLAAANGVLNPAFLGMQGVNNLSPSGAAGMRNNRGGGGRSPSGARSNSGSVVGTGSKDKDIKPDEEVDPKLLDDIPAWFRSLRLHKYTPNFQGMNWRDIVIMDENTLEAKGVAVVGARRKMLKTFELVRNKMGIEMPNPPAIPA